MRVFSSTVLAVFSLMFATLPAPTHAQTNTKKFICNPIESKIKDEKYASLITKWITEKVAQALAIPVTKINVKLKKAKAEAQKVDLGVGASILNSVNPTFTSEPFAAEGKFSGKIEMPSLEPCQAKVKYKALISINSENETKKTEVEVEYTVPGAFKVTK
jgi:hypothetical protein